MLQNSHNMQELRSRYIDYMLRTGKATTTANTTASEVFSLWKKCGEEFFWSTIKLDDHDLRAVMRVFVQTYYPNQIRYLGGYITSVRYFRNFLAVTDGEMPPANDRVIQQNHKQRVVRSVDSVLRLTGEMLEDEHQKVLADPGYGSDYALIDSAFKRFPNNTDPELVALKIALIDMTNSTNLARHRNKIVVAELAEIIVGIRDFDDRLRQGDSSVVPIIAKSNGKINLFSFASKYCTFHSVAVYGHDDYVIYDRVVKDALPKYVAGLHKTTIEQWRLTYNYTAYKDCIDALLDENGIDIPFRRRKLDHYLWHTYRKPVEED